MPRSVLASRDGYVLVEHSLCPALMASSLIPGFSSLNPIPGLCAIEVRSSRYSPSGYDYTINLLVLTLLVSS